MTTAYKATTLAPSSTAIATLYAAPAVTTAEIKSLTLQNVTSNPVKVLVSYFDTSGSVTRELDEVTLKAHEHRNLTAEIGDQFMETADAIKLTCSVANAVQAVISVIETS